MQVIRDIGVYYRNHRYITNTVNRLMLSLYIIRTPCCLFFKCKKNSATRFICVVKCATLLGAHTHDIAMKCSIEISAAFSKASARERSPTEQ